METAIGMSSNRDARSCVQEATAKLRQPKLILFFAPVEHFKEYAELIYEKFPNSISMGATTIAAFSNSGADKNALKVVGIERGITCSAGVLEDADKYPIKYVERIKKCVDEVRNDRNTICLEFTTALLCAEESVLSTLNTVLLERKIPVFGGTAGDSGTATGTMVALNGKIHERSCVFTVIHNESGAIKIFQENIYAPISGEVYTVTKADPQKRTVMEYNHQSAVKVMAKELGVSESKVTDYFDTNPVGRIVGDNMFITANCALGTGQSVTYHARIYENSKVVFLKPDDYRSIVQKTMEKIKAEVPKPSFSIMCHCLARTLLFEGEGYLQEYAKTMGNVLGDYIGFSGYGEQYGEQHVNQTLLVAVFE